MDKEKKARLSLRLPISLIERLKLLARLQNQSLNSYVEAVLLNIAYQEPNETTIAAMKEVESGELQKTPDIDVTSIESMEKSMGL